MSSNKNSICFSHMEDPDGIISAALIKQVFNSDIKLVNYNNFINELQKIENNQNLEELIICDLEIKLNNLEIFFKIIENLSKRNVSILYIDHHNLSLNSNEKLKKLNVQIIHSSDECTSSLIYDNFIDKLRKNSSLLSACACITDNRENGIIAKKILQKNDLMYVRLNSSLIWYYIQNNQNSQKKLDVIVDQFYNNYHPLEIKNIFDEAKSFSLKINDSIDKINEKTKKFRNFECMEISNGKLEFTAEKILSTSEKNVSLVYRIYSNKIIKEIVILSNDFCKKNIGKITNDLSSTFNGTGGGDPKKSAAIIPKQNFEKFLEEFDLLLDLSTK